MRVLVIPTWYPSGEDKLMGNYHKEFTHALNKYGIEANMLYIEKERLSKPFDYLKMSKKEIIKEDNYDVYIYRILNLEPINFKLSLNKYIKTLERSFKDYLKTNPKPDILHAMCTVPVGYATCLLGKKYNIPVVITEHGGALERFFERDDLKRYGTYALENSTYSVVSSYMKDIVQKYKSECYILPNQVDTSIYKNDIKRSIDGDYHIVMVCAIRQAKRLDMAFKALKKLVDKKKDVHLDIIGEGFYENIYKESALTEGVDAYVTFLGRKDKSEISEILKNEHVLLISSELESFAIPGIEALASGLPVVATSCGGPSDFINSKTGILCKVNDPDDIANSLIKVYENYDKYKKEDLVNRAEEYSEESVVNIAKKIYDKALNK